MYNTITVLQLSSSLYRMQPMYYLCNVCHVTNSNYVEFENRSYLHYSFIVTHETANYKRIR